jgi:hypothetical protein
VCRTESLDTKLRLLGFDDGAHDKGVLFAWTLIAMLNMQEERHLHPSIETHHPTADLATVAFRYDRGGLTCFNHGIVIKRSTERQMLELGAEDESGDQMSPNTEHAIFGFQVRNHLVT